MSSNTPSSKFKSISTIGSAGRLDSTAQQRLVQSASFRRLSGDWRGTAVHSLSGATGTDKGIDYTMIADDQKHVTIFTSAELNILAAGMKLGDGAKVSQQA